MESIWSRTSSILQRPPLSEDARVDTVVIGGGMTGILTAFMLRRHGVEAIVLEAANIGSGQTQNTTAKITLQHGCIYGMLIDTFGIERARQYARANQLAIEDYRMLIQEMSIDCEWKDCPAYLYSTLDAAPLEEEERAAHQLGIGAALEQKIELPIDVKRALRFDDQAQFHPLKFLAAIAQKVPVYENTRVTQVKEGCIVTEGANVRAKNVVFATHFPFVNRPGYYFLRMHQERSYVLALENAAVLEGIYYGIDPDGLSARTASGTLLLGGGNHRTGENSKGGRYDMLRRRAREYWPHSRETAHWSAQDCMTLDGVPYIGPFASGAEGWYVATGYQKWGMTTSMAAARILTGQITGKDTPDGEVFSPSRFVLSASAQTLAEEGLQAVKGIGRSLFGLPRGKVDALPPGHGGIVTCKGETVGVYKTEDGELYAVFAQCPHLGCQLEWNPDEKSWDCPCHGSRFDYRGNLIDNPAQEGLQHA